MINATHHRKKERKMNELSKTSNNQIVENNESISYYLDSFLNYLDASTYTVETYKKGLKVFFNWLKEHGIKNPTREDVINFKNDMLESHQPTTCKVYLNAVKQLFNWLSSEGLYKNVAINIKTRKIVNHHTKHALTDYQTVELLNNMSRNKTNEKRDFAICLLCFDSGMRSVEISRAKIKDVEIIQGKPFINIRGKGYEGISRKMPIEKETESAIRDYLSSRGCSLFSVIDADKPLFAVNISGKYQEQPLTTRTISKIGKKALNTIGFGNNPGYSMHSFRHTFATINMLEGASIRENQQALGHSNITTTQIYEEEQNEMNNVSSKRVMNALLREGLKVSYGN